MTNINLGKSLVVSIVLAFGVLASMSSFAKIYVYYHPIQKKISTSNCIAAAKKARLSLFDDDFGENIIEGHYSYSNNEKDVHIIVSCLEKNNLVYVSVSTQDKDPDRYLKVFSNAYID